VETDVTLCLGQVREGSGEQLQCFIVACSLDAGAKVEVGSKFERKFERKFVRKFESNA